MSDEKPADMRFIHKQGEGYRLRLGPKLGKYFSAARYGGLDVALIAAKACRNNYQATGEFIVPPPTHQSKAAMARELGVGYRRFLAACAERSISGAIEEAKEGTLK